MYEVHITRLGRNIKDQTHTLDVPDTEGVFDWLCMMASKHLTSRDPSLFMYADNEEDDLSGTFSVEGGRFGEGTWKVIQ